MKFSPTPIHLKSGKTVILREATADDAEQVLKCTKTYVAESEYIPKLPEEHLLTVDQQREWILNFEQHPQSILLVAEYNQEIIGNIDLNGSRRIVMQHTAVIGMGMLAQWQNQGLGTEMLKAVIHFAKQHPILETIWLQLYAENKVGYAAYQKVGFQECGRIPNFFKQNGRYHDCITMYLPVK